MVVLHEKRDWTVRTGTAWRIFVVPAAKILHDHAGPRSCGPPSTWLVAHAGWSPMQVG
jgi:hypothetical protein